MKANYLMRTINKIFKIIIVLLLGCSVFNFKVAYAFDEIIYKSENKLEIFYGIDKHHYDSQIEQLNYTERFASVRTKLATEIMPEKIEDEPVQKEDVEQKETPKGKLEGNWALINLVSTIIIVLLGIFLLVSRLRKADEDEMRRSKTIRMFTSFVTIISLITFAITENVILPMVLTDKWTIVMVVLLVVQVVAFVFARRWKEVTNKSELI